METSSAIRARVTNLAEKTFTIRIRYDDAIRPNMNTLFGPLFGTEANTNRIFGTSLQKRTLIKINESTGSAQLFIDSGIRATHVVSSMLCYQSSAKICNDFQLTITF